MHFLDYKLLKERGDERIDVYGEFRRDDVRCRGSEIDDFRVGNVAAGRVGGGGGKALAQGTLARTA